MRARRLVFLVVGMACALGCMAALAAASGVTWGTAIEAPGTAALNAGLSAATLSVSCASAHNCSAGGDYTDGNGHLQAFVTTERKGHWSQAIEAPGSAALNAGGQAEALSVSCGIAGNCAAGGFYTDAAGASQAFVMTEKNENWGHAVEVPGTAVLNAGGSARVVSVSCRSAGNCSAGGSYVTAGGTVVEGFVVNEKNGLWGKALTIPGLAALNVDGVAEVTSVSCGSAGNCVAGGYYRDGSDEPRAFVANEKNGVWRAAVELPGTSSPNVHQAEVNSVSCSTPGNCGVGGIYIVGADYGQAFVASEKNGVWGSAVEVPGIKTLDLDGYASQVLSLSCAATGNCSAGGEFQDKNGFVQAFVVNEKAGVWRRAIEVPATAALNVGGAAQVTSISCASAGNCAAGGYYTDSFLGHPAFLAVEKSGVWGSAAVVPGTVGVGEPSSRADVNSVSCVTTSGGGDCSVGGDFVVFDAYGDDLGLDAFVTRP